MVSWIRARRSAITFDLGGAGLRAFQFRGRQRGGGAPRLCDALEVERPTATAEPPAEGEDVTLPPPVLDPSQVDRLVGQGCFVGRDVALVLSPPEVQFFPLQLPEAALSQAPARIEQALKWEVAQESRCSAAELEVRHWRLPRGRGQQANVMAVAMPSALALRWCDELLRTKLALRRIDVSPCALVRLARQVWQPEDTDLWGVLDLGLRHSTLTVVIGTVPAYIRTLAVSAHQWTRRLAQAFEVSYPVAEQLKREHGVQAASRGIRVEPAGGDTSSGVADGPSLTQAADLASALSSVLRDSLQGLARDVGRCFSYMMQSFPDHAVKRLFLAGGGAHLKGLPAALESVLDIPVAPLAHGAAKGTTAWKSPLRDVRLEPRAAAALGGALLDLEAS